MQFKKIKSIDPADPKSWQDKYFLTFDLDWASDDVLNDTIAMVENAGVEATWFVTHKTSTLQRLRANSNFELGIHPNFNSIFYHNSNLGSTFEEIVENILDIVPEAKSVRSHSMFQSSRIQDIFIQYGLTHDANHFIPEQSGITLKPWALWNGLIKVPHFWEDDLTALYSDYNRFYEFRNLSGLCVFDFHPIHVYLNMSEIGQY